MEDDLSEELHFHVQKEIENNIAAGMSAKDARYAALRRFGGLGQVKNSAGTSKAEMDGRILPGHQVWLADACEESCVLQLRC
jgi:hypothetical protein